MPRRRLAPLALGLAVAAASFGAIDAASAQAPKAIRPDFVRLADGQGARVVNRTLSSQQEGDRAVARLDARPGDGLVLLDGVQMGDGVIDVDLRGRDVPQQSFVGIAFHVVDSTQYDAVYFRPFNFRAAGPEQRAHAAQFVSHPLYTWQKLRAERTGQFEKAIDPPPDPTTWFHARVVIANSKVEVYVNRATTPSMVVDDLGSAKSGGVALWVGNGSDGSFANLAIAPGPAPDARPKPDAATAAGEQGLFDVATLRPTIHRLTFRSGMMNNVLVFSGADGAVLVDTGHSPAAVDEMRKAVARFSPAGVRYVVNSHAHADHVAGNSLAPAPAAVITAATLAAPPPGLSLTANAGPLRGRTGRTFPAGSTWRTGGTDIVLIPRPGLHSDADLIVYFPREAVVDMGDLLLSESIPAVRDVDGYLAFLDDVLDVFPEATIFVSGHGRDLDAAGVRAYRDDVKAMVGIVRANLAAGRTADQMVKDEVLRAFKQEYSLLSFLAPDALIPRVR
jgi:glyoxylase-like metal-dependent hydrolase (beta-lactamase superfamily II)